MSQAHLMEVCGHRTALLHYAQWRRGKRSAEQETNAERICKSA